MGIVTSLLLTVYFRFNDCLFAVFSSQRWKHVDSPRWSSSTVCPALPSHWSLWSVESFCLQTSWCRTGRQPCRDKLHHKHTLTVWQSMSVRAQGDISQPTLAEPPCCSCNLSTPPECQSPSDPTDPFYSPETQSTTFTSCSPSKETLSRHSSIKTQLKCFRSFSMFTCTLIFHLYSKYGNISNFIQVMWTEYSGWIFLLKPFPEWSVFRLRGVGYAGIIPDLVDMHMALWEYVPQSGFLRQFATHSSCLFTACAQLWNVNKPANSLLNVRGDARSKEKSTFLVGRRNTPTWVWQRGYTTGECYCSLKRTRIPP